MGRGTHLDLSSGPSGPEDAVHQGARLRLLSSDAHGCWPAWGSHRLQVKPSLTSLFSREPWLSQVFSAAGMESATTNLPRRCSATQLPSSRWRRSPWFLPGPPLRRRHEPRRTATAAPPCNCRLPSRRWRHRFLPNEGSRLDLI